MDASELDFDLPPELVAQAPAEQRGASRLLRVHRNEGPIDEAPFAELFPTLLRDDDLVVVNDTRVINARIHVTRPTGGKVELLLLHPVGPDSTERLWQAMVKPARRLDEGMLLQVSGSEAALVARTRTTGATWTVELPVDAADAPDWLETVGEQPLPPYIIGRTAGDDRYQTIYAAADGSVAAPTAGLHIDDSVYAQLRDRGQLVHVTLHVGAGTFLPIRTDSLDDHVMHSERYEVPAATDAAIRLALADGRRIVAVGTTSMRTLESVYGAAQLPRAGSTDLFIQPGYRFGCVGALLTNFHLPRSTLIALVMAFAGIEATRAAYEYAIESRMRFFSFGDAMFVA